MQNTPQITHILVDSLQTAVSDPGVLPELKPHIAGGALTYITAKSLNRYRKDGPFGKLHNIGVHFRQNSQLLQAFRNAQQPCKTPLAWIHNVAIRWSLDCAMATRALELRVPLTRLFADIEAQDPGGKWREFLGNKIEPQEWRVIMVLQRVLKDFDVACKQLQGDIVSTYYRSTYGRFDEYYSVIESLLNHLEDAVQSFILEDSEDSENEEGVRINIFEGLFTSLQPTFLQTII
jgi:hypothetical protein